MIHFWYWFLENWKDFFEALSALVVAGCAVLALHTWRKEFVGKKKIEFEAEFVEKAIDVKDFIAAVRNGFSYIDEIEKIENELKKENKYIPNSHVSFLIPKQRILKEDKYIKNFYSLRTKAIMYFGKDVLKIYGVINSIVIKITQASDELYENSYQHHLENEKEKEDLAIVWKPYASDDKIAQEIEKAVDELKLNLEPLYQDKTFKWKTLK